MEGHRKGFINVLSYVLTGGDGIAFAFQRAFNSFINKTAG